MDEIKLDLARRAAAEGGLGNVEFPHMGAGSTAASWSPASAAGSGAVSATTCAPASAPRVAKSTLSASPVWASCSLPG
jgi:hypothetical protein